MITIYNEDCFATMSRLAADGTKVDIILTSPPYGTSRNDISERSRKHHQARYDVYREALSDDEYILWTMNLFAHYDSILKENGVILYNMSYGSEHPDLLWRLLNTLIADSGFMVADCLVWKKANALPMNQSINKMTRLTEFVFVFCRRSEFDTYKANKPLITEDSRFGNKYKCHSNFIDAINNDGANALNKATFSTQFVGQLLDRYAYSTDLLVYDSFMGTGTTAVECKRRGLSCIGSELSPAQVEFANKWLAGERFAPTGVKRLF